jgi:hypothetical protein
MSRRKRDREGQLVEDTFKVVVLLVVLLALAMGGVKGFGHALGSLLSLILFVGIGGGGLALAVLIGIKIYRRKQSERGITATSQPASFSDVPLTWDASRVRETLNEIDWYQFEKFCAALLRADGFRVERKGGANPDGGVDLVVEKDGTRALIQCKHWRTWTLQEKVVREMLGSMTHFQVAQGAIYTLKGGTEPARRFAAEHQIILVNGDELAHRAASQLSSDQLEALLNSKVHHCPKCEAPMVWRTGDFTPFWGCSTYPRCRGKLNHAGAR